MALNDSKSTNTEAMDAYSQAVASAAEKVGPAVVRIDTFGERPARRGRRLRPTPSGVGSGVIFSSDGRILTNEHVVRDAEQLKVTTADGRRLPAGLVAADRSTDMAVLQVGATYLPVAQLSSHPLRIGQLVVAIGNAYGLGWSVTAGVVSALGRRITSEKITLSDLIQTDTPINPGNSGGPIVDAQGRVVGIAVAVMPYAQGIGFAIPMSTALGMISRVERSDTREGDFRLGIGGMSVPIEEAIVRHNHLPTGQGLLVLKVQPGSSADKISLRPMDIIVSVGGGYVTNWADLQRALDGLISGQPIEIGFLRGYTLRRTYLLGEPRTSFANL